MKRISYYFIHVLILLLFCACTSLPKKYSTSSDLPVIYPDYTSLIIQPNIAPMNFQIQNRGDDFIVDIQNSTGRSIHINSPKCLVQIGLKSWHKLLKEDRGGHLEVSIYRKTGKKWEKLPSILNEISEDKIDPYFAFRKIPPSNIQWA